MISGGDVKAVQGTTGHASANLLVNTYAHIQQDSRKKLGKKFEETLFLSYHRKTRLCTHRIICIQCNALQPLSSYSGVQKVCKNVQTGKTKPNGQINHRFYGRV